MASANHVEEVATAPASRTCMLPPAYDVTCDGTVVPALANPSSEPSGQPIIGQPMVEARAAHA